MENSKLTFENNGFKYSNELPWDASVEDLFDAILGIGVSATYSYKMLLKTFYEKSKELLEINFPEEIGDK
jgi:hypothetical protein